MVRPRVAGARSHGTLPMTADARVHPPAHRRGRRLPALALAALLLTSALPAVGRAAPILSTVDYTASIPVTATDWSPGFPPSVTNPLVLPRFDPSLGTLRSVTISGDYTFENDFSMRFIAPATITVAATEARLAIERPDKSVLFSATPADVSKQQSFNGPTFPHSVSFPTLTRKEALSPVTLTSAADLALFTGTGPGQALGLPALATSHSTFTSSTGNGDGMVNTRAGVNIMVQYSYTPIPEPATLAVLGGGLLAVLTVRRSRSRRTS